MPNTRFVGANSNFARDNGGVNPPVICNGDPTYVGAPSRVEIAGAPMENFLSGNKSTPWMVPLGTGNDGSDLVVDIDLGGSKTIWANGLMGVRGSTAQPNSYIFYGINSATYNPASFVAQDTISIRKPDGGRVRSAPFIARYLRLRFTFAAFSTTDWSPGFMFASSLSISNDIDANPSYGYTETLKYEVARSRTIGGAPVRVFMGDMRMQWLLPFRNITTASKDELMGFVTSKQPFIYVTHEDKLFEVVPIEDSWKCEQVFLDLWNVSLEVEQT